MLLTTTENNSLLNSKFENIRLSYKLYIEQIIANMFKIFKHRLILDGIGCKVWKKKNKLKFKLGYSTPYYINIPNGIRVSIFKQRKLVIFGVNQQCIKNFIFNIRNLR